MMNTEHTRICKEAVVVYLKFVKRQWKAAKNSVKIGYG
jgi:hypothetical protein